MTSPKPDKIRRLTLLMWVAMALAAVAYGTMLEVPSWDDAGPSRSATGSVIPPAPDAIASAAGTLGGSVPVRTTPTGAPVQPVPASPPMTRKTTFDGLTLRIVGDGPETDGGPVVILLHGFGAPGTDLVPLGRALHAPANTRFIFPTAPLSLPGGAMDARAWWMIDFTDRETQMADGSGLDLAAKVPPEMADRRAWMEGFLQHLDTVLEGTPGPVILGGFSQGAMLACDVALHTSTPLAGLAMLSGTLLAEDLWVPRMGNLAGVSVFQSHGTFDPVLPYPMAERLRDRLRAADVRLTWLPFSGGHEIPGPVLSGLASFIRDVTGD